MKFLSVTLFAIVCFFKFSDGESKLKSVNVFFRHGDRTPTPGCRFPTDPNYESNFYPYGLGALTNKGKLRVYKLGQLLRERYEHFLGDVYLPELLYARASDKDRTKMSLQLVLAALFPPHALQKWHDELNWQPIPYYYEPASKDNVTATVHDEKYLMEKQRVHETEEIRNRTSEFNEFLIELTKLTGRHISSISFAKNIYDTLIAETYMNLTLPSWINKVFPKLYEAVLLEYDVITYDESITNALVGVLMSKVTTDLLASINMTHSSTHLLASNDIIYMMQPKIYLYSLHDLNIAGILRSLKVYKTHVPKYTSAVIIELLEENEEYFVKVLYYLGIPTEIIELQIPGCPVLCPLKHYLTVINEVLTANQD